MAIMPSFESVLLEVHQSLGLKLENEKDKGKLAQLKKPFAAHIEIVRGLIDEIFDALGMDELAKQDAGFNLFNFGNFNIAVEHSTWTFDADMRQIGWFLAGYSYAPGLGRLVANWSLEQPLDKGMPGGRFWYLPEMREKDGEKQLVMPVAQVMEWLMDLLDQPMDHIAARLGGRDETESIERVLYNWLKGDVPRIDNIERYFAEGAALDFKGALILDDMLSSEQRFNTSLEFVKRKGLDATKLREQIPMSEPGRLEAILAGAASAEENLRFADLVATRYAPPSLRTIRQRLLIARATQDGYRRMVKHLLGKDFDETCTDHGVNKVLQLFDIYKLSYNLTVEASVQCGRNEIEENEYFERKIAPLDNNGIFLSVLPSARDFAAPALGQKLSRFFSELSPGGPLEDHFGHDVASAIHIIKRNAKRFQREIEVQLKTQEAVNQLKTKSHWNRVQEITSFEVASNVALTPELGLKIRRMAAIRMRELAQTPSEVAEAISLELGQLLNNDDRQHRAKDSKARVDALIVEAQASPAYDLWRANILQYLAKHHLAFNDFDKAHKLFDEALEACHERSFGKLRGEIARAAFAIVVERPPKTFSLGNYERYYRNMLAYGGFEGEFTEELPSLEDAACQVAEYFWDTLYLPYSGENFEQPFAKEQAKQLIGNTFTLIRTGDWYSLKAWFKENPSLRDKRLRAVRGNSALMSWLKMLYEFERIQPNLSAMMPAHLSGELEQFSNHLENWHKAICLMIDEWPKLVNMDDFKKQTPLMMSANQGDHVIVSKLLQAGAKANQQDFRGRTALHAAVAARSLQCVEELLTHAPGVASISMFDKQTTLHTAVRVGHPEIVRTLIKHAPELEVCRNEYEQTALDLAKLLHSDVDAMRYLRKQMDSEGRETGSSIDYQEIVSVLSAE